jgi:hypothetical protein
LARKVRSFAMAQDYVKYKLHEAVEDLGASALPIQRRLYNAAMVLHTSKVDDFDDPEVGARFVAVMNALTARPAIGDEGTLQATTTALSDDEAEEIAKEIFRLDLVCRPLD